MKDSSLSTEKLMRIALDEFSNKPLQLASLNEIIKLSDFNKGSFYYRFRDKEELYCAVLEQIHIQHLDIFNELLLTTIKRNDASVLLRLVFDSIEKLHHYNEKYTRLLFMHEHFNQHQLSLPVDFTESVFSRFVVLTKDIYSTVQINQIKKFYYSLHYDFPIKLNLDINTTSSDKEVLHVKTNASITSNQLSIEEFLSLFQSTPGISFLFGRSQSGKTTITHRLQEELFKSKKSCVVINQDHEILHFTKRQYRQLYRSIESLDQAFFHTILKFLHIDFKTRKHHRLTNYAYLLALKPDYLIMDDVFRSLSTNEVELIYQSILKFMPKESKILVIGTKIPIAIEEPNLIFFYHNYHIILAYSNQEIMSAKQEDFIICFQNNDVQQIRFLSSEEWGSDSIHAWLKTIKIDYILPIYHAIPTLFLTKTGDDLR